MGCNINPLAATICLTGLIGACVDNPHLAAMSVTKGSRLRPNRLKTCPTIIGACANAGVWVAGGELLAVTRKMLVRCTTQCQH